MNGKGDRRRPTDERKFRENFDGINWTKGPGFVIRHVRSSPNRVSCRQCNHENRSGEAIPNAYHDCLKNL